MKWVKIKKDLMIISLMFVVNSLAILYFNYDFQDTFVLFVTSFTEC